MPHTFAKPYYYIALRGLTSSNCGLFGYVSTYYVLAISEGK
jgi:hypothetical protein